MELLIEMLSPGFLMRNAICTNLLVGFACPLVGMFLVLRRLVFMGVALPQISSAGVAVALSMHVWFGDYHGPHEPVERTVAFLGSALVSLVAVTWLALLEWRGRGSVEGRLGAAYVLAAALSILMLAKCPQAEQGWLSMLKGEIIAVSGKEMGLTAVSLGAVLVLLGVFHKEFLLVSYDRELAVTLHKNVRGWDLGLYLLLGLTVSVSVLSVGPLIAFGFLLVPVLIAHRFARNMKQLAVMASGIGGASAFVGFYVAYRWDFPVGPTDVALLGLVYAGAAGWQRLAGGRRSPERKGNDACESR